MKRAKLTDKQKAIFDFIIEYRKQRGFPPTIQEIGRQFGISSPNGVKEHLKALDRKQYIQLIPKKSRGIQIPDQRPPEVPLSPAVSYPLLDPASAAGASARNIPADQELDVNDFLPTQKDVFAFQVPDDALAADGFRAGDMVLARRKKDAGKDELVVVEVDGAIMVRRLGAPAKTGLRLMPGLEPGSRSATVDATVVGVVAGLMRRLDKK